MSYLRSLCLLACSCALHTLCCVLVLFVFVLCLLCTMFPASLDCPFLTVHSVFSNVYLITLSSCIQHVLCVNVGGNRPRECSEINGTHPDGVYNIYPDGSDLAIPVYCDMQTEHGQWTVSIFYHMNNPRLPVQFDMIYLLLNLTVSK